MYFCFCLIIFAIFFRNIQKLPHMGFVHNLWKYSDLILFVTRSNDYPTDDSSPWEEVGKGTEKR
jgi:hypothetical protein